MQNFVTISTRIAEGGKGLGGLTPSSIFNPPSYCL